MPNRYRTALPSIMRQIELLEANVARGDVHSKALLASRISYVNRELVVPDRDIRRLELLRSAAESGDRDYLFRYGRELWRVAWVRQEEGYADHAAEALMKALAMGEPRAAEVLAHMRSQSPPWLSHDAVPQVFAKDEFQWWQMAADMGRLPAVCQLGNGMYEAYRRAADDEARKRFDIREARANLERCAAYHPIRDRERPKPAVFGAPALYATKLVATYSSMSNSAGWANMHLGEMHVEAIGVARDAAKARTYYRRALDVHGFKEARSQLRALGG
jgi:TPR repeat protein